MKAVHYFMNKALMSHPFDVSVEAGLITLQLKTPKIHGRNLPRKSPKSFNYIFTQSESLRKGWLQRLVKGSLMGLL